MCAAPPDQPAEQESDHAAHDIEPREVRDANDSAEYLREATDSEGIINLDDCLARLLDVGASAAIGRGDLRAQDQEPPSREYLRASLIGYDGCLGAVATACMPSRTRAMYAVYAVQHFVSAVFLGELRRLDPRRADSVALWLNEVRHDQRAVEKVMADWREEMDAGADTVGPLPATPLPRSPYEDPIGTVRCGTDGRYAVKVDTGLHGWYSPGGRRHHHNETTGLHVVHLDKDGRERPNTGQETMLRAAIAGEHHEMELSYALQQLKVATVRADAAEAKLREAERERDLAVAHDRQPYPTAWAYEQACRALHHHRSRADAAERERDANRAKLDEIRAVLADPKYHRPKSGREIHRNQTEKVARILAIVERITTEPADTGLELDWESGITFGPGIGGSADVSISGWPADELHVWLRVESYAHRNEYADVVLHPAEADQIAGLLRRAACRVREETGQPSLAAADAWARECAHNDEALAAAQESVAAEADDEPSAYDMDPDIDELEDGEEARH